MGENVTEVMSSSTGILEMSLQSSSKLIDISAGLFTAISLFDFTLQTILILFVFLLILLRRGRGREKLGNLICGILIVFTFILVRLSLLPTLLAPLHVNIDFVHFLPESGIRVLFFFNLTLICCLFGLSCLVCIYFMLTVRVSGVKKVDEGTEDKKPMVIIVMPIYNEEPDALFRAVESAIRCDYPPQCKHVFLSFDDDSESSLYLALMRKLHVLTGQVAGEIIEKCQGGGANKMIFPQRLELVIEGVRVTFCRFPHEGKSATQAKTFNLLNDLYGRDESEATNSWVLFIDSDIILHENAVHNFISCAQSRSKLKAATGLVTCRTSRQFNLYQYLQDCEYVEGQMFARTMEACLGAVTCLPGALTLVRLSALQKVAPKYFVQLDKRRSIDYHRLHLGEDRFMTFLLMELKDVGSWEITFVANAQCKTDAPESFQKLLKQRRRWFLGGLTNDLAMLGSRVMWQKYPLILLFKLYFYSIRGIDWFFWSAVIYFVRDLHQMGTPESGQSAMDDKGFGVMIYVILSFFGIKLLLLSVNAFLMNRLKMPASVLLLFFLVPVFNLMVILYSIWTWNVRSWGGPRTDLPQEQVKDHSPTESQVKMINEVMRRREEPVGIRRKSLAQIKLAGRIIQSRLESNGTQGITCHSPPLDETEEVSRVVEQPVKSPMPSIKKFVPFPCQMEFLGGGDPTTVHDNFLHPVTLALARSRRESVSMPDLSKMNLSSAGVGGTYLFESLSPGARERASSFRLNKEDLALLGALTNSENSGQQSSQFILSLVS